MPQSVSTGDEAAISVFVSGDRGAGPGSGKVQNARNATSSEGIREGSFSGASVRPVPSPTLLRIG